jgi:uncharacterized protein (TIGR00266 family)
MEHKIEGKIQQLLKIRLEKDEEITAEPGLMNWMTDNIEVTTKMQGNLEHVLKRVVTQESIFLVTFKAAGDEGFITFSKPCIGEVIMFKLKEGENIICQKEAFICGEKSIKIEPHIMKDILVGITGGEGFILQKIQGPGKVFVYLEGVVNEKKLKEGQKMKVKFGNIGVCESECKMNVEFTGTVNALFSQHGFFYVIIEGPGKVWLQSNSPNRSYIPLPSGIPIPKLIPNI